MTTQTEALKMVLEALQDYVDEYGPWSDDSGAQYVLRVGKEALAQPEEEKLHPVHIGVDVTKEGTAVTAFYRKPNAVMEMFYSQFHPLAQPEQEQIAAWLEKECDEQYLADRVRAGDYAKEKGHTENCVALADDIGKRHLSPSLVGVGDKDYTAQPKQEPVAWRWRMSLVQDRYWQYSKQPHPNALSKEPLYTTPPQPEHPPHRHCECAECVEYFKPEQEPVATVKRNSSGQIYIEWRDGEGAIASLIGAEFYTAPPQPKQKHQWCRGECVKCGMSIEKQKPVAWVSEIEEEAELMLEKPKFSAVALYTSPPTQQSCSQRTWVGLDNDDLIWIYSNSDKIGQAISNTEAKLKGKNG